MALNLLWHGAVVLSRCANPECGHPFLNLRTGKLFVVEACDLALPQLGMRKLEHYWLCDRCALVWTLIYDPARGVLLGPLRRPMASVRVVSVRSGSDVNTR